VTLNERRRLTLHINIKKVLNYIFILLVLNGMIIPAITAQENTAWIWSVNASDVEGYNKDYKPAGIYITTDKFNLSWDIIPSPGENVKDAMLQIYPKDKSKSGEIYTEVIPKKGSKYIPLEKIAEDLSKSLTENQRTYEIKINASANATGSRQANEWHIHIIQIDVEKPGTIEIKKEIRDWKDADPSGWKFTVEGPKGTSISKKYEKFTDKSGIVIFEGLRPGSYSITESPRDGWSQISTIPKEVIIAPGPNNQQVFINIPNTLKIIKRDPEGHPLSGWVFNVESKKGDSDFGLVTTAPTDNSGIIYYHGFPSGEYEIKEVPQEGWRLKSINRSQIKFESGKTETVEAINTKTGTLKIIKKDSEGQPLSGWTFSINPKNPEEGLDQFDQTEPTDTSGTVIVRDLFPGEYNIGENTKSGWASVTPETQIVNLKPGITSEMNFINAPLIDLTIIKFEDRNGNGRRDVDASGSSNEPGLTDWHFTVRGPGGLTREGITDNDGIAVVHGLTPGKYVVTEDISQTSNPGWICTTQNPQTVQISRRLDNTISFGNKVNIIEISKFNDSNLNGKFDDNERGLPNWDFNVADKNGHVTSAKTNIAGLATVKGLAPGEYFITEVPQDGWINTTSLGRTISIRAGEDVLVSPPFGNIKSSRFEIFKFNDTNRNGRLDSDESGLPGWVFNIRCPNGSMVKTEPTNSEGYTFVDGLFPGRYIVSEIPIEGWLTTTPPAVAMTLGIGDRKQKALFGNYYCLPCHRIREPKLPYSNDTEIVVIKDVSNISAEKIDQDNGYVVNYNITLCPSRGLKNIAAVPTDIVIAVDNSPSINNLNRSAIEGVQKLAGDIGAYDKQKVTRVGLISWSDKNNSRTEVPLINDSEGIITTASKIKFAEGKQTNYQIGLDTALDAFKNAGIVSGRDKKIVIITDASDNGYQKPANVMDARYSDYTIFAIVVGDYKTTEAYEMLDSLTRAHHGYVISMKDLSELEGALVKMATSGSPVKNVQLVEVLPNYLVLLNGTARDDQGKVRLNGDSKDWTTTTIVWDIGDLSTCWSTDFQATFCWKLPADVNQPRMASYVNYTDEKGVSRTILLPEHEINIVPTSGQKPQPVEKKQPGFEVLFSFVGISMAGYFCRRMRQ